MYYHCRICANDSAAPRFEHKERAAVLAHARKKHPREVPHEIIEKREPGGEYKSATNPKSGTVHRLAEYDHVTMVAVAGCGASFNIVEGHLAWHDGTEDDTEHCELCEWD